MDVETPFQDVEAIVGVSFAACFGKLVPAVRSLVVNMLNM
jgi:hypothetical protein